MASFKLPFAPHRFRAVLDDDLTDYEFIEEVIHTADGARLTVCGELLQNYVGQGSPSLDDFEIDEVNFNRLTRTGDVDIRYEISFYFGCDDVNTSRKFKETITFKLDFAAKEITFTIPEDIKRDTVDEF